MTLAIQWTRIDNDSNSNPRYVCHMNNLLNKQEQEQANDTTKLCQLYDKATKRANEIGGRKYNFKSYNGGIVFQSFNLNHTEIAIARVVGASN
jgi:hypothetical protein